MAGRPAAVIACALLLAASLADAQTSTLTPFGWSASVSVGTAAGKRPVSDARIRLVFANTPSQPATQAAFTPDEPATPDPLDVKVTAQLARDSNGVLAHYVLGSDADGVPLFFLDGGVRQVSVPMPAFDAPASGDLRQVVNVDNLCSLVFHLHAIDAQGPFGGFFVSLLPTQGEGQASFGQMGPPSPGTDPTGLRGYVAVTEDGEPTALAEVLVRPSATYRARGTIIIDTVPVDFEAKDIYALDAACHLIPPLPPDGVASASVNGGTTGRLSGSLWLSEDPLAGAAGPIVTTYAMQVSDPEFLQSMHLMSLTPLGDQPAPYDLTLRAQAWLLRPRLSIGWPDGRLEVLDLPHGITDGRWTPAIPMPVSPFGSHRGVYPDASVVLRPGEEEQAVFSAPMAFAEGRIVPRGCATAADIVDGTVSFDGLPDGPEPRYRDEQLREVIASSGNDQGAGRAPLLGHDGGYEFVGTPGPWRETGARVVFAHSGAADGTDFSGDVQLLYEGSSVSLPTRRSLAPSTVHDLPLGAVTITLRVRNADGSYRPFQHPGARIANASFSDPALGLAGKFIANANSAHPLATEQRVRIVAPPGVWNVEGTAEVPQNPDGTGPVTVAPFPTIERVPFRPPRADGSCDAICLDVQSGEYVGDDLVPPALSVDAPPPDHTRLAAVTLTGHVNDESPIESVVANDVPATLESDPAGGMRFSVTVPLAGGDNTIRLAATDRCGEVRELSYPVTRIVNHPPHLFPVGDRTVQEGEVLTVVIGADDPDGDTLTYRLEGATLPEAGPVVDPSTGLVLWATDYASEGVYPVTYVVSDGELETREDATITVTHVNEPPVILAVDGRFAHGELPLVFKAREGEPIALAIDALDGDDDPLTYSAAAREATPARGWSAEDGLFSWTPAYGEAGTYVVELTVRDPSDASDTVEITLEVAPTNRPPVLGEVPTQLVNEGETLTFTISGSDPDGDALTWSFTGDGRALPAALSTAPNAGGLDVTWPVDFASAGLWPFVVRVDDGRGGIAEKRGAIVVRDVNRAPVFEPVPDQYPAGFPGEFSYVVTDPDGDGLVCTPLELPPGAVFDPYAREVRWPELPADSHYVARIRCSDGTLASELDVNVINSWGALAGGCACGPGGAASVFWLFGLALFRRRKR